MKRTKQIWNAVAVLLTAGLLAVVLSSGALASAAYDSEIVENAVKVHVPFIENEGQVENDAVRFYARTFGGTLFVEDGGILTYSLPAGNGTGTVIREFLSDGEGVFPVGIDHSSTKVSYFIGDDSENWQRNLQTYNAVSLGEVYAGTSLSLKAHGDNVEKIFTIEPYADPDAIRVRVEGAADALRVNEAGELEVGTAAGVVRFTKPVAFQERGGRREEVAVAYTVYDMETYGFSVGNYDSTRPLIIDPLLASTFIGGSGSDMGYDITLDSAGNVYVTGETSSTDFPTTSGAYDTTYNGGTYDAFVAKLSADGSTLVYSTYLGGNGEDSGGGIAVDGTGNVYITGKTYSTNFPTTDTAQDRTLNGGRDGFVAKLNANGNDLVYSTYLGGNSWDYGKCIAVDTSGNAYIGGFTHGSFLTTAGAAQTTFGGAGDGFITKLNADGSAINYSTYLGGNSWECISGIVVDGAGNAYVASHTHSTDFPTTPGAWDETCDNCQTNVCTDGAVAKLNADGSEFIYSTLIGGSITPGSESFSAIAIDEASNAYLVGETTVSDFPTTTNALQPNFGGGDSDAVVVKLNADGSDLIYSTYLGGSGVERGHDIAIDCDGNAYVTGYTASTDFPTADPLQAENGGSYDAFVAKLNDDGSALLYSTYLGGIGYENVCNPPHGNAGIAIDDTGNIYLTGSTTSTDFPTESPLQPNFGGGSYDAFVAKMVHRYDITNVHELQNMKSNLSGNYYLANDIDCSGIANFEPIGNQSNPFTGTFSGNGYMISNLTINRPNEKYVGLFGYILNADITNVSLMNANIVGRSEVGSLIGYLELSTVSDSSAIGNVTGTSHQIGGLIGESYNGEGISDCYAEVTVNAENANEVGGFIGRIWDGTLNTISDSYCMGAVNAASGNRVGGFAGYSKSGDFIRCFSTGSVTANNQVGGMVGYTTENAGIHNCYSQSSITGNSEVGGIIGYFNSYHDGASHSYYAGTINGTSNVGGFIGRYYAGTLQNNFWDYEKTGLPSHQDTGNTGNMGGIDGKTTAEMMLEDTFNGWDFDNTWVMADYPHLQLGIPEEDLIPATDTDGDGVPDVWDMDNSTPTGYWTDPQGVGRRWGDMNGDGKLTSVDALMILQAAVGKIGP